MLPHKPRVCSIDDICVVMSLLALFTERGGDTSPERMERAEDFQTILDQMQAAGNLFGSKQAAENAPEEALIMEANMFGVALEQFKAVYEDADLVVNNSLEFMALAKDQLGYELRLVVRNARVELSIYRVFSPGVSPTFTDVEVRISGGKHLVLSHTIAHGIGGDLIGSLPKDQEEVIKFVTEQHLPNLIKQHPHCVFFQSERYSKLSKDIERGVSSKGRN